MRPETKYLRWMFGTTLGLAVIVAGLNWVVDPFSVFDAPRLAGFNANKPGYVDHLRLTHAYRIERLKPDCILLGTSRAGRGLRPDHPALANDSCYNLALPAISMHEMRRYLQHAQATRPLKTIILALDFRVMNTPPDQSGAFSERRLAVDAQGQDQHRLFSARLPDLVSSLLSVRALQASATTVRKQAWVKDTLLPNGHWAPLNERYDHVTGFRAYTENTLRRYAEARRNESVFQRNADEFRNLLRDAYATGAKVYLFISPSHAWHWQALWTSGLWPRFEEMKRLIVRTNETEAERAKQAAFPVWDFSGSYGPALEPVPSDAAETMRWFWEPVHYKPRLGDVVLNRVMGREVDDPSVADFGVRLESVDAEPHLARLRALQQTFASKQPAAVAVISEFAERVSGPILKTSVTTDRQ